MREIKFRVWDKEEKQWLEYKKIHIGWQIPIDKDPIKIDGYFFVSKDGKVCSDLEYCIQNKNFELMQYTGLKDKNGKEIYEGDILQKETCSKDDPAYGFYGEICTVIWSEELLGFALQTSDPKVKIWMNFLGLEIIGNIYENPELLEGNT